MSHRIIPSVWLNLSWLAAREDCAVVAPPATVGTAVEPPSLPAGTIGESVVDEEGIIEAAVEQTTGEPFVPIVAEPDSGGVDEPSFCTIRRSVTVVIVIVSTM
uniref:Secreted protein n=1 Tax=Anopheles culicifacies TaxID=139723 RepID=A0A182MVH8_9DIPT